MSFLLLVVGLMTAAVGLVTIGFGIPINAFSLGNTLIISGTIAVATGLILIGLALVLGQLRRIAEALRTKPMPRQAAAESVEARRLPRPMLQRPWRPRRSNCRCPSRWRRAAAAAANARAARPGAAFPRHRERAARSARLAARQDETRRRRRCRRPAAAPMVEPPMVELTDEAPLSPRPPQRPAMPPDGARARAQGLVAQSRCRRPRPGHDGAARRPARRTADASRNAAGRAAEGQGALRSGVAGPRQCAGSAGRAQGRGQGRAP